MQNIQWNDPESINSARTAINAISPEAGMAFDAYTLDLYC